MKSKNNQKNLLLLLIVILGVFAVNNYLVNPKMKLLRDKENELKQLANDQLKIENGSDPVSEIQTLLTQARSRVITLGQALPSHINQEEIIKYHAALIETYNIEGNQFAYRWNLEKKKQSDEVMSIPEVLNAFEDYLQGNKDALDSIPVYDAQQDPEKEAKNAGNDENPKDQLGDLTLSIGFRSTYNDFKGLLEAIETGHYTAIVKRISLSKVPDAMSDVTGQLEIMFPYYYDGEELKELEWQLLEEDIGRLDPFLEKVRTQVIKDQQAVHDPTTVDFFMFLKSKVADGPTVGIQKMDMRNTSLYADGNEAIPLELWLVKNENTYQFKYTLASQAYPLDGSWITFEPLEDHIVLKINATERGLEDKAGCLLKLHNTTDKLLEIHTYYDDPNLSRLEVTAVEGKYVRYEH